MTKEKLIELAREAGWDYANDSSGYDPLWKFGELVAAAEREACAKVCDGSANEAPNSWQFRMGANHCAEAIRARGRHERTN